MSGGPAQAGSDVWSEWLLRRRHGGDPAYAQTIRSMVDRYAGRVVEGAALGPGMTLLDVGSGEGLIAFHAIEQAGPGLNVILADISAPMLEYAQAQAVERGVRAQCRFVHCGADRLEAIADASVDAVTTRAVLAYVPDKPAAFREFHRVLKPGGRLSIAEPIFQDEAFQACVLRTKAEELASQPGDEFVRLLHRWKAAQFPDTEEKILASPIANYNERHLLRFAQLAGFAEMRLEFHVDLGRSSNSSWEVFIHTSPHPLAPSLATLFEQQFSVAERQLFEQRLRPVVESGRSEITDRIAYLRALR